MMIKYTKILFIFLIVFSLFCQPIEVDAKSAETLRELKKELNDLKKQKNDSDKKEENTKDEINDKNKQIQDAYFAIEKANSDIEASKKKIEESNKEITELSKIAGELMVLYEQMQNNDGYLEFVTGASSLTELIMRMDAIDSLLDYNKETIDKLENLIVSNEKEQVSLIKKQDDLKKSISSYESSIAGLKEDLKYFAEITEDIDDQIKNQQTLINYYEDLGCKIDQNLTDCVSIANNRGWVKPLDYGYVTSLFGYRYIFGKYSFHNGIDLGGNREGTNVYSTTSGTVAAITRRSSCGGNKVYVHAYVNGAPYTMAYLHLRDIKVSVGDKVNINTVVGTVGGGASTPWDRCTTGAHLHFTVAKGFYLGGGSGSYSSYSTYVARSIKPPGFPGLYGKFYSRTAWFD